MLVLAIDLADRMQPVVDQFAAPWRAGPDDCARALELIAAGRAATVGALLAHFPPARRWALELGVMWMMKLGLLDWLEPVEQD